MDNINQSVTLFFDEFLYNAFDKCYHFLYKGDYYDDIKENNCSLLLYPILLTCIILSGCSSNTEATKTISSSSSSAKISLSSSSSSTQKDKKEQEEKAKAEKERIAQEEAQKAAEAQKQQEEAQKAAAAQQQERTVYVARNGAASVYWYNPRNTRFDRVISMTEAAAITAGKRHSSRE